MKVDIWMVLFYGACAALGTGSTMGLRIGISHFLTVCLALSMCLLQKWILEKWA